MSIQNNDSDALDRKIAECMMQDATLTSQQLGAKVGLSPSAANERLRRLKQNGALKKMTALISAEFMDMGLCAFVFAVLDGKKHHEYFLKAIRSNASILECHHVTGEYSYILKVRCSTTKSLEQLITDFLKGKCNVTKTMTQIVLMSHKDESLIVD
jgi:Lrp/AsnC family transcriptional regulator, leucine-responsive regulatory protein